MNYTWSTLDFVSMAGQAGGLGELIVPGYYIPTQQAHSSVSSILSRLEAPEIGGVGFAPGAQRDKADMALSMAHNLLLNVLDLQKEHFKLEALDQPLQVALQDYLDMWQRGEKADVTPTTGE
jgi:hypothetical protein